MSEPYHVVCPHCDGVNRIPAARPAGAARCGKCHRALFEGQPLALNAERFQRHLDRSDIPLVVDFWAPWCAPCRAMAPAFAAAAGRLEPRLRLAKVDTEQERLLAGRHAIRAIPTLVVFHGGQERARQAGALAPERLLAWLEPFANGSGSSRSTG